MKRLVQRFICWRKGHIADVDSIGYWFCWRCGNGVQPPAPKERARDWDQGSEVLMDRYDLAWRALARGDETGDYSIQPKDGDDVKQD